MRLSELLISWDQLKGLSMTGGLATDRIPLLSEVFQLVVGRCVINIEKAGAQSRA
jgi:hypothetical protein